MTHVSSLKYKINYFQQVQDLNDVHMKHIHNYINNILFVQNIYYFAQTQEKV